MSNYFDHLLLLLLLLLQCGIITMTVLVLVLINDTRHSSRLKYLPAYDRSSVSLHTPYQIPRFQLHSQWYIFFQ